MKLKLPPFPIVPSARTLLLLAALAPVAVVIAATAPSAWIIAPAAGLALLLVMLADGWLAGSLIHLTVNAPHDGEVGEEVLVRVDAAIARSGNAPLPQAALGFDARLGEQGAAQFLLQPTGEPSHFTGMALLRPVRRGTGNLNVLSLRWPGPLGLAHRQHSMALNDKLRVWPNLAPVRSPALQNFLRDAQFGLIARRIRGEGTQFEALSEYEPGMDRRRIDWKASARHTRLFARENESERNNQIVFAFDCGQAMCEPVDGLPRIDRAVSAALTCAYVVLKGGDKVALFGFAQRPQIMTPFIGDARAFHRLQSAAAGLDYQAAEPNFTLALATLTSKLKRRSLVVLFSDFTDPTSAELMVESLGRLVDKHLVLFVTIADSEIEGLIAAPPADIATLARSVTADSLAQQRKLVLQRLRRMGVDVIEAPWAAIGPRLIDRYFAIRASEAIG